MDQQLSLVEKLSEESSSNLNTVSSAMEEMNATVNEISEQTNPLALNATIEAARAGAVEEQSITSQEIAQNIAHAASGIQETTQHISDSSPSSAKIATDVSSGNENSTEAAKSSVQLTDNVEKMMDFAGRLQFILAKFKV